MVIENPEKLANIIKKAAIATNTRVLLQSSWSSFASDCELIFNLGNCPHDWLFTKVAGVVHHGGAGTTFAGVRAGVPTLICPFFGDQHLWGVAVARVKVGLDPVPVHHLTADDLRKAFVTMRGEGDDCQMAARARELGARMASEDGVAGAVESFYNQLPLSDLVCDASLMLPDRDVRLARWFCPSHSLKLCEEACQALREIEQHFVEYKYSMCWGFALPPPNVARAFAQAATSSAFEGVDVSFRLVYNPLKGIFEGYKEAGLCPQCPHTCESTLLGSVPLVRRVRRAPCSATSAVFTKASLTVLSA